MAGTAQLGLFDICAKKHGGARQSVAANLRIEPHKTTRRERVYARIVLAGPHGMTCKEIAAIEGLPMHSVSGRLSELKALGRAFDTERVREHGTVIVSDLIHRGQTA